MFDINIKCLFEIFIAITHWLLLASTVQGHGRLINPPARASMWRFGFNTPTNDDDHALYCGGFDHQWNHNGGRCGVCGDPFDGIRENEAGGRYARGVIAKTYRQGQTIRVSVDLTKSHLGWFEFRLCPNNNPNRRVTHACLDSNLLRLQDGSTRYHVTSWSSKVHHITLRLPSHVFCSQCVLQWKYNAGNSWGCTGQNTGCCVGCGHQEQFYGCSDVAIRRGFPSTHPGAQQYINNNNNNDNNNNHHSNTGIGSVVGYRPLGGVGDKSSITNNGHSITNQGLFIRG